MEDLVEEIVGDISDEDDEPSEAIIKTADGSYIIAGSIPLDDLNEGLKLSLHSENHETLNGYLIDQLGIIPDDDAKDTIKIDNLYFEILEVKDVYKRQVLINPLFKMLAHFLLNLNAQFSTSIKHCQQYTLNNQILINQLLH